MTSKMGFIDFQGFHTVADSTMSNYTGLLMGTPRGQIRQTCAPDWSSPWDECPFIWKEFDAAHYVTMYIEDGSQTFNWGGQSGFKKEPTNSYLHPLFQALLPLRRQYSQSLALNWWDLALFAWDDEVQGYCASNETVPVFMLRHTRRFLDKFSPVDNANEAKTKLPFFSFTYWANPFHDDMYTVPTFDKDLLTFMKKLNGNRQLLESTLIVFLGDHGTRYTYFRSGSMEAYIERSLPPLFIRIPEQIRSRFPDYAEALKWNGANRLVTAFDVHHTMRHLLDLDSNKFKAVLDDRSSLFHRVSGHRTCIQLHLDPATCVCNTTLDRQSLSNPYILNKLMPFVQEKLNQVVSESGYKEECAEWSTGIESIISAHLLSKRSSSSSLISTSSSLDVLLNFKAEPLQAQFSIKIRIWLNGMEWESANLLGSFTRVNKYGNQSACLPTKTDRDKKMKELCVCKNKVS